MTSRRKGRRYPAGVQESSEPRWLDDDERQAWLILASLMMQLGPALDAQLRRDVGLSYFEYVVLSVLSEATERTRRMSELAALADGSLSRLSQVVGRLEGRGWVRRCPDPADGRFTLAILTEAGWEKVVEAAPGHVGEVRRMVFDPLTPRQVRHLTDIGQRILRAVAPQEGRPER